MGRPCGASVIYPPLDVRGGYLASAPGDYYLTVSRLVEYKRADLAADFVAAHIDEFRSGKQRRFESVFR